VRSAHSFDKLGVTGSSPVPPTYEARCKWRVSSFSGFVIVRAGWTAIASFARLSTLHPFERAAEFLQLAA
jgi:hypothetical protein